MSNEDLSQYLPADLFLKSAVVEKNPDMSFRELVAGFFGVSPEEITRIRRTKDAKGWDITIEGLYEPSQEEDYQWDLGPEEYWDEESEEPEWMSPKDMGVAQKMDWSDDEENGLVRLRPEEDWFDDDDQEDWEREGYRNEIAYQNRWRDYTEPEEEMDDDEEDYRRDPYSPWNY